MNTLARLLVLLLMPLFAQTSRAEDPINTSWGVAAQGYDVVSYFEESKAVEGSKKFEFKWMDATWRFASEAHRDAFAKEPERYAPQFGGYCAWAVSQGYTANIDPEAWKIVEGKLYLNYSPKVQKRWEEDIPGNITKAEKNWPELLKK